ncbi:hypothetical protein OHA88_41490 [Streptomyces sp. NBC_00353]|uniref:hypothetical protein n=1 Tax=Streptomyces sp. NBC_00353 TaxID=2975722 RepID=UPI002E26D84B
MDHSHAEHRRVRFEIDTSGSLVQGSSAARKRYVVPQSSTSTDSERPAPFVLAIKRDRPYAPLLL